MKAGVGNNNNNNNNLFDQVELILMKMTHTIQMIQELFNISQRKLIIIHWQEFKLKVDC